jgi:hypothetical protein
MKIETILHIIDYIKAVEKTEEKLNDLGWSTQVPLEGTYTYSLHEVVMDLMGIPAEDEKGFVRDCYFDCFYDSDDSLEVFKLLRANSIKSLHQIILRLV